MVAQLREVLTDDTQGGLRAAGGVLIALGAIVLLIRQTSFAGPWGEFVVFLVLAVLVKFLFWSGYLGARWSGSTSAWHVVFLVFAIVLVPPTLFVFLNWIGGDVDAPFNTAWIFLLTAAASFLALRGARVRIGALLGAAALVVAWLALWDALLDDSVFDDVGTLRGLLLVSSLLLLVLALVVSNADTPERSGRDVITAAGLTAVAAGGLTIFAFPALIVPVGFGAESVNTSISASLFWDLELLVATVVTLVYAAGSGSRGAGYVGAFGVVAFIFSVGFDLDDSSPAGTAAGWPLVLLVLGAAALVVTAMPALRRRDN